MHTETLSNLWEKFFKSLKFCLKSDFIIFNNLIKNNPEKEFWKIENLFLQIKSEIKIKLFQKYKNYFKNSKISEMIESLNLKSFLNIFSDLESFEITEIDSCFKEFLSSK